MKKILLISSGQPSLNPRLVKEADALAEAGYQVTILYAYWNNWGTQMDTALIAQKKWHAIRVGGDPQHNRITYVISRLLHKAGRIMIQKAGWYKYFAELAIARSSFFLLKAARKHKADLYIGHNLGALPATVHAAKIHGALCGFDAEDFHRNEISDNPDDALVKLKTYIEDKYLPQLNYLTASSPGISTKYSGLYQTLSPVILLNVFPTNNSITIPAEQRTALKLFWFSQTVSLARGVGDCIEALQLLNNPGIELHLLGFMPAPVKQQLAGLAQNKVNIKFYPPIPPGEIIAFASQFDIGLALEDPVPLNRDICLTNKIFTYIQAGLALIATDTSAQSELLNQYPATGKTYQKGNVKMLAGLIEYYNANREALHQTRIAARDVAIGPLNWEQEGEKFLRLIKNTLAK